MNRFSRFCAGVAVFLTVLGVSSCSPSSSSHPSWGYGSGGPTIVGADQPNYQLISLLRDKQVYSLLAVCGSSSGGCSGSSGIPSGYWSARKDGRRIDWRFSSPDEKSVKLVIDGQEFDVPRGALFLISVADTPSRVEQLTIDPGQLQAAWEAISLMGLATADPQIAKFLDACKLSKPAEPGSVLSRGDS
jgi:hypothetical protein